MSTPETERKPKKTSSPRISLSAKHAQTEVGLQLISICQSVTGDGRLADEEITDLRHWINENQGSNLPAIQHLAVTLEAVLADGVITSAERQVVYKAIEAVLPTEHRQLAASLRRTAEGIDKEVDKQTKAAQKAAEREQKALNKGRSANFMVAGTAYADRADRIDGCIDPYDTAHLRRDHNNSHSHNAIQVLTSNGSMIGFVPEDLAADLAPLLDSGWLQKAHFTKILSGRRAPIPVVQAQLFAPGADARGVAGMDQIAASIQQTKRTELITTLKGLLIGVATVAAFILWLRR